MRDVYHVCIYFIPVYRCVCVCVCTLVLGSTLSMGGLGSPVNVNKASDVVLGETILLCSFATCIR